MKGLNEAVREKIEIYEPLEMEQQIRVGNADDDVMMMSSSIEENTKRG